MCEMMIIEPDPIYFDADHPFLYYIVNKDAAPLFAGKIQTF